MKNVILRSVTLLVIYSLVLAPLPLYSEGSGNSALRDVPKLEKDAGTAFSAQVGRTGGAISFEGVEVNLPAGAVDIPVTITVIKLGGTTPVGGGRQNVTRGAAAYRFLPDGQQFLKPVRVTIPYDPELNKSEAALSNLFTYFFNEKSKRWERLERISLNSAASTVTSLTTHFTDMINTTLTLPESPDPVQFDLNSIKNLEAARPDAGVPGLKGLEGDWSGSASFSLPFNYPAGRGKASPQLSLRYNSGRSPGVMGLGFSVPVSTIDTDTRFGIPNYDGKDTYLLDGEELVNTTPNATGLFTYRQRKEGRFARIERFYNPSSGTDYWKVTDRDGTIRYYGNYANIPDGAEQSAPWIGPERSDGGRVYRWYLARIIDMDGNSVDYRYRYDGNDKNLYIASVSWSGVHGNDADESGYYRIDFAYNEAGHLEPTEESTRLGYSEEREEAYGWTAGYAASLGAGVRQDIRSDGRGKFISRTSKRLDKIRVSAGEHDSRAELRSYEFYYRMDDFGRTILDRYEERAPGAEVPLYSYGFDYYRLDQTEEGNPRGFGPEESWGVGSGAVEKGLSDSRSVSAGGNLYTGLEVFINIPFLGKKTLLALGIRGGYTGGSNVSLTDLTDINGDGIPELVWKDGSDVAGFAADPELYGWAGEAVSLDNFGGSLSKSRNSSASLGLSAKIAAVSGGSYQAVELGRRESAPLWTSTGMDSSMWWRKGPPSSD